MRKANSLCERERRHFFQPGPELADTICFIVIPALNYTLGSVHVVHLQVALQTTAVPETSLSSPEMQFCPHCVMRYGQTENSSLSFGPSHPEVLFWTITRARESIFHHHRYGSALLLGV